MSYVQLFDMVAGSCTKDTNVEDRPVQRPRQRLKMKQRLKISGGQNDRV